MLNVLFPSALFCDAFLCLLAVLQNPRPSHTGFQPLVRPPLFFFPHTSLFEMRCFLLLRCVTDRTFGGVGRCTLSLSFAPFFLTLFLNHLLFSFFWLALSRPFRLLWAREQPPDAARRHPPLQQPRARAPAARVPLLLLCCCCRCADRTGGVRLGVSRRGTKQPHDRLWVEPRRARVQPPSDSAAVPQ